MWEHCKVCKFLSLKEICLKGWGNEYCEGGDFEPSEYFTLLRFIEEQKKNDVIGKNTYKKLKNLLERGYKNEL